MNQSGDSGLDCDSCGAPAPANAKFCGQCGRQITGTAAQSAEYKQVTVLFADVVHSMDIAAAVGAERLRTIMADLVDRAASVVQRFGGTVDKFTGDGIMAVFGAPKSLEDHAVRACRAALAIQDDAVRLAVEVKDRDGVDLLLRVGLNSGQVIAGGIGSRSFGYTAVGEQVGMAQRMESVAPPGGVMVSESTARLVRDVAVLTEKEMVSIKGAHARVPAHRLIAMAPHRGALRDSEATLVGRRQQLKTIIELLDSATRGQGTVVGVVGAAGIGKSRLLREAAAVATAQGVEVVWAFCESLASGIALHAVSYLLRAAAGVGELTGPQARDQVRTRFPQADPEDLLLLDDLLGIADPAVAAPHIDPDARRRRLTNLVNAASLARTRPVMYVIEDVQWIDDASESLLTEFLAVLSQTPTVVLISHRPEYLGALTQAAGSRIISLAPLDNSEIATLLGELLGGDASVRELTRTVAGRAVGNPFFAEEIVHDLVERAVLVGVRGAYVCTADVAEVSVPATLQAIIAARIDRLEPNAKRSVGAASVIGSRFEADLLAALDVSPALEQPLKAELIDQVAAAPRAEYVFRHPLIRAVAYESQLKSDRSELHRRLARVIQSRDPSSVDENAALIAEHVQAAGDVAGAYAWHMRAAGWLAHRDLSGAGQNWERARECADALPANDPHRTALRIAPRVMLCFNGIRVHAATTDVRFAELQQLCEAADDKASLAFGMAGMLPVHALHGRVREASQLASEYMTLVESIGDPTLTVLLAFVALPIKMETGPIADALRWAQDSVELSEGNPLLEPMRAAAFATRGSAKWAQGTRGWREDLDMAIAMARGTDPMVHGLVVSVVYSAIAAGVLLPSDEVLANIDEALRVAERSSDDIALGLTRMSMGFALLYRDSAAERERGAEVLAQVREMIVARRFYASELPIVEAWIAREMFAGGDHDGALTMMRNAVDTLLCTGQWGYLSATAGVLVDTLLARGDADDIDEADGVIQRLVTGPDEAPMYRDVWLLRLRALVARARGEEMRFRALVARYHAAATTLGFEWHMAMAEALSVSSAQKASGSKILTAGDGIPRGRIRRTMPLAGFAVRAAGDRIIAGLREKTGDTGAVARFHERNAERYTELLGHSKGVLMKIGQILSMFDSTVLGGGYLPYHASLTRLQADAPPMHPELARQTLQADLGKSVDEVFAWFSDEPMAAASIGQVHRAVMHDGREVAVKIQYPGAADAIRADLANQEMMAKLLRFVSSASGAATPDLRASTREVTARIAEEIDYRHEAANISAFSELYRGHPFIRVPDVVPEASGDRVLTMTYLDGLDWTAAKKADQDLKNAWAEVISRFLAGSIRHANLFHCDPHPGNYRFGPDGSVGFVDFGCVKVLSEPQRSGLVRMARATLDGRKDDLRQLMVESGFLLSDSAMTAEQAYQWWSATLHEMLAAQPFTYTQEDPLRAIRGFVDLRDADHPARQMVLPEETAFFPRLYIGMYTLFATLHATIPARAINDDMDGVAEPVTALGNQHHEWLRARGLPYGLDSRT